MLPEVNLLYVHMSKSLQTAIVLAVKPVPVSATTHPQRRSLEPTPAPAPAPRLRGRLPRQVLLRMERGPPVPADRVLCGPGRAPTPETDIGGRLAGQTSLAPLPSPARPPHTAGCRRPAGSGRARHAVSWQAKGAITVPTARKALNAV